MFYFVSKTLEMSPTDQLVLQQMVPSSARFTLLLVEKLRLAAPGILKELNIFKVAIEDLDRSNMMDILVAANETTNAKVDENAAVKMNMEQATETWRSIVTDKRWNPECKDFIFTSCGCNSNISSKFVADEQTVKVNIKEIKNGTPIIVVSEEFEALKQMDHKRKSQDRKWLGSRSKRLQTATIEERENVESRTDLFGGQFSQEARGNKTGVRSIQTDGSSNASTVVKTQELRKVHIDSLLEQIRSRIHDMVIKNQEIENLKAQVKRLVIGYHDGLNVNNNSIAMSRTKQSLENRSHLRKQEKITQQALEADLKDQMNDWTSKSEFFDESSDVKSENIVNMSDRKNHQYRKSPNRDRRCWICGEIGHQKKNCPEKNKPIQCFNCNGFGHIARNCHLTDQTSG